ncbi:Arc family DNA binding domain-containing protein [Labilibaculum filiforme]|uniref:Arc family DNA binding domain-containing protein n=1 Tax=Labilibaculum filiforme TaxID=1940526 RepID=A0A2N3I200_9BACT|nr:Arc family DNA binding domain-containing protein [Labilibaculum filiforme]PKQ64344.1 Arc family DNA binding domain-containing protein [Labilibaculum filiforme]
MAKKKSFVLRIDPEMYKKLEKWAVDEFRSTNGQIEWILNKALNDAGRKKDKGLKDTDTLEE